MRWRLILSGPMRPAENMALDEALLAAGRCPTLRLYSWSPPALSLGYFQKITEVDRGLLRLHGLDLVRRPTGGGAIAHVDELTFCFTAPEGCFPYLGPIYESYERVHSALATGFRGLRLEATIRGEGRSLTSDAEGPDFYCFYHSASPDLQVDGRKLLGSAQRRRASRVLHHGSLPLVANPITPGTASMSAALGRPVSFDEAVQAVLSGLRQGLGMTFEEGAPEAQEVSLSLELTKKYASQEFTARR